jgi:hypothetical protein
MPPIFYRGDSKHPDFDALYDLKERLTTLLDRNESQYLLSTQGRQKVQSRLKDRAKSVLNDTVTDFLDLHKKWGKWAYKEAYKPAAEAVLQRERQPTSGKESGSRLRSAGLSLGGPGGPIAALLGLGVLAGGGYALSQFTDIGESHANRRFVA